MTNDRNQTKKPNIVLMIIDDLGYADMGFYPGAPEDITEMKTPGIDQLRASGTYYTQAYATSPICSPARTGLITGQHQARWGNYWFHHGGLNKGTLTLPQALKEHGYRTVKIGKTHHNGGDAEYPLEHGFDDFFGFVDHTHDYLRLSEDDIMAYGGDNAKSAHIGPMIRDGAQGKVFESYKNKYTTELFTEEALAYLDQEDDRPFFMEIAHNAVHHPTYVGHPDYLKDFGLEQFPFWDPTEESYDEWHQKWGWMGEIDPNGRKRYLATLKCLDDCILKVTDKLDAMGVRDETMIIFISDNGGTINTYACNTPLNGYKYTLEEGGIRVPLIMSYPKAFASNPISDQLVSSMDLFPTIMNLIGEDVPDNLDGKAINTADTSQDSYDVHDTLFWDSGRGHYAVRYRDWKLFHQDETYEMNNFKVEDGQCVRDEKFVITKGTKLYDLSKDIGEENDVASDNPELVDEINAMYSKWRSEMGEPVHGLQLNYYSDLYDK